MYFARNSNKMLVDLRIFNYFCTLVDKLTSKQVDELALY